MELTAATPTKVFHIVTACGRNYGWSAVDEEQARRDMKDRRMEIVDITVLNEYQTDVYHAEGQEDLVAELNEAVEGGEAA